MDTQSTQNDLVSSSDVNGEYVYSPKGEEIGHIDHLMIDKKSGKVAYAIMHFGGFMGLGEEAYPVPWQKLSYDTTRHGFSTDLTKEQVEGAPQPKQDWMRDRREEQRLHDHYGIAHPYWL